jgi:hypothetical protein
MSTQSPAEILYDLSTMHMVARSLQVVADMGVADALGDEPMSAEALAEKVGANAEALNRVLRLMANYGVFAVEDGRFRHTPASRQMREDAPDSMRAWIRSTGMELNWQSYGKMEHTVRTGEPARRLFTGGDFFADYLPQHPETAKLFNEAMTSAAHRRVTAITNAYDFSPYGTIADIGGGRGHLIRGVLEATPSAQGILFDLPHAVDPTRELNVPRLTIIGGNFFETPLPQADAYMLMAVIHDWSDEESVRILSAVRKVAPPHAKLLLIERVIADGDVPDIGRRIDIHMLVALTGKERTRGDFEALYQAAGFRLDRVIPANGGASILEGSVAA